MSPTLIPKRPQEASRWHKMAFKTAPELRLNFGYNVDDLGSPNGGQNEAHNHSKISFGTPGPPRGLQGAIWVPFGSHLGAIFASFW